MKKSAKTVPEAGVSADDDTGGVASHTPNNNMLADQVRLDVLDTFNNISRDEDNILDQLYIRQIYSDFYHVDF